MNIELTPAPDDLADRIDRITVEDYIAKLLRLDIDTEFALEAGQLRYEIEQPDEHGLVPVVVRRINDNGLVIRARYHWTQLVAE